MAVHSSTINWDEVNTLTERKFLPKVADNIFEANAFWSVVPKMTVDGGTFLQAPLLYAEGPGGPYSGTEVLAAPETDQVTGANFDWKFYYAAATFRNQDKLKNSGAPAFANLLSIQMQTMQMTMENQLGIGLHSDGSTNTKHITGLRAMVSGSGTTYGGISKTTNSWWASPVDTTTTTLTIPAMRTRRGAATKAKNKPNLGITTQAVYDIYYGLLQPQQRFMNTALASGGFDNVVFEGMPLTVDDHCPDDYLYMLNTKFMKLISHRDENMRLRPFMEPVNQPQVRTAYLLYAGSLVGNNCRFQTVFTGITA